jgi:dipeptidyl aminopeptidase/acylaminoacyl peptidase
MMKILNLLACFVLTLHLFSQENLSYQKPPKEILDLVDFERAPSVWLDSKNENIVFGYRDTYKTLEDLNQDEVRLGGLRINPSTNISSTITYLTNLKVRKFLAKDLIQVRNLPQNPKIAHPTWSPDEKMLAFTHTSSEGVELWVLDIEKAEARKISTGFINANTSSPFAWFKDSKSLLVKMLPSKRLQMKDPSKEIPKGPTVSVSEGEKAQNRTYQDLLKNPTDEQNFFALVQCELVQIDLNGSSSVWKTQDLYTSFSFSPDGNYVLVTSLKKPFSYLVPYQRFPMSQVVYTAKGELVKEVNAIALSEVLPKGFMSVRTGKRNMEWRADKAASLYYVEALDGGDAEKNADFRDELFSWDAPFTGNPTSLLRLKQRFSSITWGTDKMAIVFDYWWNTRNSKTYLFNPSDSKQEAKILYDRNYQDKYSDPGEFQTKKNKYGKDVLHLEGNSAFLLGEGFSEKGQFPFLDKYDLSTLKSTRLYQSTYTDKLENLVRILDVQKGDLLVRIESKNEFPNYYMRTISKKKNGIIPLTHFENPFKSLENVHKEVITYKRKDGVELSATLYLPLGYDKNKKEKKPMIMWAYPREFKDKSSAGQNTSNPNEFTFPFYGSPIYWVTRGYVVLDDAAFPIVGEGAQEPNDTFIEQLVANAEAAINAVDSMGYIDRSKVAVGGHSYGAFMTANLLTHSTLFACGVARSGAYNRTLTPFGFQSEERSYWDVPHIYNTMSPFMTADKMKFPLLLIHGEADNNPGLLPYKVNDTSTH